MGRTIFAEQIIGATNDKLGDLFTQLLKSHRSSFHLFVTSISISTFDDWDFKLLSELGLSTEIARVAEGEERVVF